MKRSEIPCAYDCPDRSPRCHGECEKYKTYKYKMAQTKAQKEHELMCNREFHAFKLYVDGKRRK